ncbi:uncharacterized protein MAM_01036 [Metarhizium album ARSEF 1941]|uniref:Myb-like domain-containing protein n=1 Tax=Metarhizium album (strain ARSEF 1941) TaxID=1081103 RepID=A0A0B2X8Y6_METAS|nr:uncharacterized protein MAM_01036 [Metarhizium album ARSEF 1941]KHO02035.1 hypothetical protein MAM_01036 [Metarhizium album ARSEF 1941]
MPATKKWETTDELDLCMAIILTGGSTNSYKWPEIHEIMTSIGHGFTKDAISQHFTKVILRQFKGRHGFPPGKLESVSPAKTKKRAAEDAAESPSKRRAD